MAIETLFEPLQYEFFRNGLLAAAMTGAICGLIGVYIVLRNMSYIGHGLSHSVFGGAVVSYVMSWNFYLGAGLWGFLSALLINSVAKRKKIGADAVIGIVTTASFAVGVVLISRVRKFTRNFEAALFGNILGVTADDLIVIAVVSLVSAALIFVFYKQLLFTTFDPEVAKVYGVRTEWIDAGFALVLAATIVVSMQVLGVMLIVAAIVIPAATARLLTHNFHRLVFTSIGLGVLCGVGGMYLSFLSNASSGATIVLFAATVFAAALAYDSFRRRAVRAVSAPVVHPAQHEHSHQHGDILHQHEHPVKLDVEHSHHPAAASSAPAGTPASGGVNGADRVHVIIDGMTCAYCVRAVERALSRVDGVTAVRVDLAARSVDVTLDGTRPGGGERVREAIRSAGYQPLG
ncbi:MAG TPA: metal ABC transporter permease [Nitrospiria bacterium]|nr:metal ABC transporter permease [Nitrospiria bacterium]